MPDAAVRRAYAAAPWGQVHFAGAGAGAGRPAIVLIHQTPRSWDEFREVLAVLSGRFELVAVDLPGMGASDPHPAGASIEAYADAVLAVADHIGLGRFHVCGHHTGGVVAIELAARERGRVASATLSSTPWIDAATRSLRRQHPPPVDLAEPRLDGGHLVELWEQRRRHYPEDRALALLRRFAADALRAADPAEGHRAVGEYVMEARVPRVACPVQIVEHTADPFATRHTDAIKAAFPGAAFAAIPGGAIALEHTATAFAEVLAGFVEQVDSNPAAPPAATPMEEPSP